MTEVIISKNSMDDFFTPNYAGNDDIRITNVSKVSIGGRLIWVEFTEDEQPRYRAYGRYEFANVVVQTDDNFAVYPVGDKNFKHFDYLSE